MDIYNNLSSEEYLNREIVKGDNHERIKCKKCQKIFPRFSIINGKKIDSRKRVYCFECSPFGEYKMTGKESKFYKKDANIKYRNNVTIDRICKTCGRIFHQNSRNNECSTCRSKKKRKQNKLDAIAYKGGKCCKCGYLKCIKALEFHHLDPNTKDLLMCCNWDTKIDKLKNELDKCILVCANCHREIHYNEKINDE